MQTHYHLDNIAKKEGKKQQQQQQKVIPEMYDYFGSFKVRLFWQFLSMTNLAVSKYTSLIVNVFEDGTDGRPAVM